MTMRSIDPKYFDIWYWLYCWAHWRFGVWDDRRNQQMQKELAVITRRGETYNDWRIYCPYTPVHYLPACSVSTYKMAFKYEMLNVKSLKSTVKICANSAIVPTLTGGIPKF